MADQAELLAEAYKRNLLPPEMKVAYEEAMKRGLVRAPSQEFVADQGNIGQRFLIGMGRGFTDIGQAAKQSALHVGGLFQPKQLSEVVTGQSPAQRYDAQITDEASLYDAGMGDSGAAAWGRFAGNVAPTLPLGLVGAAGARAALAGRAGVAATAAGEGAAGGAAMTAAQPVFGGDYAQGKAGQFAINTLLGGGISGGLAKLGQGVEQGVSAGANLPSSLALRAANQIAAPSGVMRTITGSPSAAQVAKGTSLGERVGIDFTPAQASGSRAGNTIENLARQSVFTADEAFAGDFARSRQLINAVGRTAKQISSSAGLDPAAVGTSVQNVVTSAIRKIADARSAWGRRAYGAIDRAAGGNKVVGTQNLRNEMGAILKENEGVVGGDSAKIANQIRGWLNGQDKTLAFGDAGRISASTALRQLQTFAKGARGEQGIFSDLATRGPDRALASRLRDALMRDLDGAVANNGRGDLGAMIKRANDGWRKYSSELDAIEGSALGGAVGDDFAGEISGIAFNKVAPEKVFQRLAATQPSQIAVVKQYLTRINPQVWADFQKTRLTDALNAARVPPSSAGSRTLPVDPVRFVQELTGGAGQNGKAGLNRLKAIYGDSPVWPQIQDLLEASRRLGDSYGKNFSNTAVAQQAMGAMDRLTQFASGAVRQGIGGAATLAGLKHYTRHAMNGVPVAPTSYQLPAIAGQARRVGAALPPAVVPLFADEEQ